METIITKEMLFQEIENISENEYGSILKIIHGFRNISDNEKISDEVALKNIFSLRGILKDEKMSSVDLQHSIGKIWAEKYETD